MLSEGFPSRIKLFVVDSPNSTVIAFAPELIPDTYNVARDKIYELSYGIPPTASLHLLRFAKLILEIPSG